MSTTPGSTSIYTKGYEGRSIESFLRALDLNHIDVLVDVRLTPWSHKRDFVKSKLADALSSHSIEYVHMPEFGNPRSLCRQRRETGDWDQSRGWLPRPPDLTQWRAGGLSRSTPRQVDLSAVHGGRSG